MVVIKGLIHMEWNNREIQRILSKERKETMYFVQEKAIIQEHRNNTGSVKLMCYVTVTVTQYYVKEIKASSKGEGSN